MQIPIPYFSPMARFIQLFILLLLLASPLYGQEQPDSATAAVQYPGVAEVVPSSSQVVEQAVQAKVKIITFKDVTAFEDRIREAQKRRQELDERISELGDMAGWSFDQLLNLRKQLWEERSFLRKDLDALSERLAELEGVRKEWNEKKTFWKNWEAALPESDLKVSQEAFQKVGEAVEGILLIASDTSRLLVKLQQEVTALHEKNQQTLNQIDTTLSALRKETFKKNAPSFADPDYYSQFNPELLTSLKSGFARAQRIRGDFFHNQGWIIALQGLVMFVLAWFILRYRRQAQGTREWQFILHHPWATGIFVAICALGFLYATPPALWRLLLSVLAAFSASILILGLVKNPHKRLIVYLLAFLFVFSMALQIITFPRPLYRLYLALISLLGAPVLLVLVSQNLRAHGGKSDSFTWALRLGVLVLAVSFVTQFAGYSTLSARLIGSSINTVFLALFAAMFIHLGRGGIEYLLTQDFIRKMRFFRRFGGELNVRLKGVFQVVIIAYAALYLLEIWGIYDSASQAWNELLGMGVTIGDNHITARMVLGAVLVLYLSVLISWALRALLDSEVFPRQNIDRGVRDSIKKLLHYILVLIGFLIAVSMAGIALRNFAILAGAFGIGIGFGLQNIVNNFVSGLILLFERPIKVGDVVVLADEWAFVKKIGLRSTVVETFNKSEIIVPNSELISEKVTNWTLSTTMARVVLPVGVAYGSNVPLVLSVLQEAAKEHPDVLSDPSPSPIFVGFGNSSLDFELRAWVADADKLLTVKSDLGQYIDRRFREEGVEIPFPQSDLHLRSIDERILGKIVREAAVKKAPRGK